jgi:polyisoprenoid-binding protein YceI
MQPRRTRAPSPAMSTPRPDPLYLPNVTENTWWLDPRRSNLGFQARALYGLRTMRGEFREFDGTLDLRLDPAIELVVNAESLTTGNEHRDRRLLAADFLYTEKRSTITFISTDVAVDGETLSIRGELSAATRNVMLELTASFRHEEGELVIDASALVDHRELGMTVNPFWVNRGRTELSAKARLIRG